MAAEVVEDGPDQRDRTVGVAQDEFSEQSVHLASQFLPQPGVGDLPEGECPLIAVHHRSTGVDIGFDLIGCDQALAKAVDGRAGDLVERLARGSKVAPLALREAVRQGHAKGRRNVAVHQHADKLPDPDEQLAGGEHGESHRGDGAGRDSLRQQHRDTPGQHRSLARTCPCLHQKGAVVDRNGGPPRVVIPKRSW